MKKRLVTAALIISGIFTTVFGQQHTENKADQVLRSSGRVNPSTLGMEIEIPLGAYPGRGIDVPVSLSYSSKLWRVEYSNLKQPAVNNPDTCISINHPKYSENSASGWTTSMAVPFIEYVGADNLFNAQGFPAPTYSPPCDAPTFDNHAYVRRVVLHLPSGETHELRIDDTIKTYPSVSDCTDNNPETPCHPNDPDLPLNWTGWYYSADGSNLKYFEDRTNNQYFLQMPDGSRYDFAAALDQLNSATIRKAPKFTDRHGNFTGYHEPTVQYPNGYWTDTLGKIISVPFGLSAPGSPNVQIYEMPGMTGVYKFHWKKLNGGTPQTSALTDINNPNYQLKYMADRATAAPNEIPRENVLFFSNFENWVIDNRAPLFNPVVLAEIELPTGQRYKFTYDNYGRIERVFYPTGAEERFAYDLVPVLSHTDPGAINAQSNFGITRREVFPSAGQGTPYRWQYSAAYAEPNGYLVTVTNPDQTRTERFLHRNSDSSGAGTFGYDTALAGMPYEERTFSSANRIVFRKLTTWTKTSLSLGGVLTAQTADWHPRVTEEESIIYDPAGNGVSATAKYDYDGDLSRRETPVLPNNTSFYDYVAAGSPLPANPLKSAETTFLINDPAYPQWVKDVYKSRNMIGLATRSIVKNSAGEVVSQSEMKYDDGALSPEIGRGNPTTSRVWDSTKGSPDNPSAYLSSFAKFDGYGNQTESTDPKGNTTVTEFDPAHHAFPVKITSPIPDPTGATGSNTAFVTETVFDLTTGLPLTTTDPNGQITAMEYDPVTLRLNKVIPPSGAGETETIHYDEPNNYRIKTKTRIDSNKWAESITYFDGLGRPFRIEQIDSGGSIFVEKEFDAEGRVKRVTNPFRAGQTKHWTTYVYDEASRIKEVILPDGAKVKTDDGVLISDLTGTTRTITDPAGKKRRGVADSLGRMIRVIEDADGQNLETNYIFDTLGNLRQTIQGEQSRYFLHDSLGRLLYARQPEQEANPAFQATDPVTGNTGWSIGYRYDDNGNITSTTDARGISVEGTYDNLNRLIFRDFSDSTPDVSFYYDGTGLDAVPVYSKGKTTRVSSEVSESLYTSFDNLGRILLSQQKTGGQIYSFGYQYNLSGLIAETYPSGKVIGYEFNENGDLSKVTGLTGGGCSDGCAKTYANSFAYNSSGQVERLKFGNGKWETAVYNNRSQVTQIGLGSGSADTSAWKVDYQYGAWENNSLNPLKNNGNLARQTITVPGMVHQLVQKYEYDNLNRLLSATETSNNSVTWRQSFQYDRYGNRRFNEPGTTTLLDANNLTNPTIDTATNRFSANQGFLYDKDGNLTREAGGKQFLYDAESHQTEVRDADNQTVATYLYDGEGRRVKKVLANTLEETIFVYDAGGQLAAEYVVNPSQPAETSATRYLTNDHLGSPRVITDQNGRVITRKDYMAFGEETHTAQRTSSLGYTLPDNLRQGYTGYQKDDETGLDFAQARYYNSAHGRFTSVDPLTASATIKNPQTFNRYSYVLNSPYKFVDPLGLISSSTGAHGNDENREPKCNLQCRVKTGNIRKSDLAILQWHVANGTALGYTVQNALPNLPNTLSPGNRSSLAAGKPGAAQTARDAGPDDEASPSRETTSEAEANEDDLVEIWYLPPPVENPESLIGQPPMKEPGMSRTECVALCKIAGKLPHTSTWRKSFTVFGNPNIAPGTLIATFDANGRYPNKNHGNHAAIFLSQDEGGIWVIDQWHGLKSIQKRYIPLKAGLTDPSNNARAFSVIAIAERMSKEEAARRFGK